MSTPDFQEVGLASLLQQRQVRSQPLKLLLPFIPELLLLVIPELLLLVTLSIAVLRGVVFGAPPGLIVATTALLSFPLLPPRRTALLHLLGAVALEVPVLLALVALIGASRDRHRGPTARDHRPRRIARPLGDVVSIRR